LSSNYQQQVCILGFQCYIFLHLCHGSATKLWAMAGSVQQPGELLALSRILADLFKLVYQRKENVLSMNLHTVSLGLLCSVLHAICALMVVSLVFFEGVSRLWLSFTCAQALHICLHS
jgi:hypothetical protein